MVIRKASHAGSWYPRKKEALIKDLESSFRDSQFGPGKLPKSLNREARTILGAVSPHAGYAFSGRCAAFSYLKLFEEKIPDTVVILGTDHVGYGGVALLGDGAWETPLGNLKIDSELSQKLIESSDIMVDDPSAFTGFMEQEHNIEIQLPFIKFCAENKDVKIVTIKISGRKDYSTLDVLARDIATSIEALNKDIVIVASSDMSHKNVSNKKQLDRFKQIDQNVTDAFEELDAQKTLAAASQTTVCGAQTITTLMLVCKHFGCNNGKLLKYYTSTDVRGEYGYCVGYFSGILMKIA
ncbi:MAG: AmmeMemoRadiSam system protein B [Promethearchaeota archaeon]